MATSFFIILEITSYTIKNTPHSEQSSHWDAHFVDKELCRKLQCLQT